MSLFRKNRLIAVIAQKVIFWIRHQVLSVMADGCCFKAMRILYDKTGFFSEKKTGLPPQSVAISNSIFCVDQWEFLGVVSKTDVTRVS